MTTATAVRYVEMRIAKVVGLVAADDEWFHYVVLEEVPATGGLPSRSATLRRSAPGDLLERVISVLLFQERPTAWRRRPSRGDGGLDVGEPSPDGYHVYQIKGFTGSMTSSRRGQARPPVLAADPG